MPNTAIEASTLRLMAAELGPESPLPSFVALQRLPDPSGSPGIPADMLDRISYGRLASPLPYPIQNGYGRRLRPRDVPAIRLVNDRFEAYVLPELGGRVWSLRDRRAGRDLVFANDRLQYANLALTDAWCSGGIEWNLGSTGHATTTSRPVFAAVVESDSGPLLRLWEWERTRDLVFSVDLMLADDVPGLLAFVRVRNLDPEPKPLYWWTNIAVPESPGVRVLAPAERAWRTAYDGSIRLVDVPHPDDPNADMSRPLTATRAADYFFDIPAAVRRWVAAVEQGGGCTVQTATEALRGRKLFLWGTGTGGARWQEWLCGPDRRYLEIQAGLATTQLEHLRLAAGAEISWAEAYVSLDVGSDGTSGDWPGAVATVTQALERVLPDGQLADRHASWHREIADRAPADLLAAGSAAGMAELTVRGIEPDRLPGTPFGQPRQDPLRVLTQLVREGTVDQDAAAAELLIPPISARWREPFERVADGWWGQLMIGIRAHAAGDLAGAARAYEDSRRRRPSAWAARGLALLAVAGGDHAGAAERYREALDLAPDCVPLLIEASEHALADESPGDALDLLDRARAGWVGHGRLRLQRCRALLAAGRHDEARAILAGGLEVADLREGETLESVWRAAYPDQPLPAAYDFGMTAPREPGEQGLDG